MEENLSQIQPTEPKKLSKKLILILVIISILIVGYFALAKTQDFWPFQISDKRQGIRDNEICIQVITPAKNPKTGEVRDFSTPCNVPRGWEKL